MRGIKLDNAIPPAIPPGNLRRCKNCKEYKDVTKDTFGTVVHTLSGGRKKRYWRSRCRACANKARKGKRGGTWTREEQNARDRALTRLAKITPELFLPIMKEELKNAYRKEGRSEAEIQALLEKRTEYVRYYIEKASA